MALSKNWNSFVAIFLCAQFCFLNCSTSKIDHEEHIKLTHPHKNESLKGKWVLKKFHNHDIEVDRSTESKIPTLNINPTKKNIGGQDGCNIFSAKITSLKTNRFEIGKMRRTLRGCRKKLYHEVYKNALSQTRFYDLIGQKLFLLNESQEILLEFERLE